MPNYCLSNSNPSTLIVNNLRIKSQGILTAEYDEIEIEYLTERDKAYDVTFGFTSSGYNGTQFITATLGQPLGAVVIVQDGMFFGIYVDGNYVHVGGNPYVPAIFYTAYIYEVRENLSKALVRKKSKFRLSVSNARGLIYQSPYSETKQPYDIVCGADECPDGCCKLSCDTYPGYCCVKVR